MKEINSQGPIDTPTDAADAQLVGQVQEARQRLAAQIDRRIVGQQEVVDQLLTGLLAGGHVLLVGVPGLAKTTLVKTLAAALELDFGRIQFTPDLMPSDITGTEIIEEGDGGGRRFRFVPGPVFCHLLLADEVNRTPPKTQAALLEAMQERAVTVAGQTHTITAPFIVFATQNPIEQAGTYPLPEAQLDRFMLQVDVAYPSRDEEVEIVRRTTAPELHDIEPVLDRRQVLELQRLVPRVPVADHLIELAVALVRRTRPDDPEASDEIRRYVSWGAGPRAAQMLVLAAKARTVLRGRFAVEREDITALAPAVLRHRLVLRFEAEAEGIGVDDLIGRLVDAAR